MRGQRPGDPDLRRTTSNHVQLFSPVPLRHRQHESRPSGRTVTAETNGNYAGRLAANRLRNGEFMQVPGIIAVPGITSFIWTSG